MVTNAALTRLRCLIIMAMDGVGIGDGTIGDIIIGDITIGVGTTGA